MPHAVSVSSEARVGVVVLTGYVTGRGAVRAGRDLLTQPGWEPGFDEVWDFLEAREVDFSPEGLNRLVRAALAHRDRIGPNRVAVVTVREVLDVLLQLFGVLTADMDRTYQSFRTLGEAAAWLGVDADLLERLRRGAVGDAA